jgi:hypothetical protein
MPETQFYENDNSDRPSRGWNFYLGEDLQNHHQMDIDCCCSRACHRLLLKP